MEVGDDGGGAGRANHGATYRVNKMSSTNRVGGSEAGERRSVHRESDDPFILCLNIDTPIKLVTSPLWGWAWVYCQDNVCH